MIDVKKYQVGVLGTNAYVLTDKETNHTAVVDPGFADKKLTEALESAGEGNVKYILLTHGHFDHIGAVCEYAERFGAKIVISSPEVPFLTDNSLNLSGRLFRGLEPCTADVVLEDGDVITLGNTEIRFVLTPGHTQGSGCFVVEEDGVIFSGDTLFYRSIGRSDLPTGDAQVFAESIKKLFDLQGDYKVYPGHDRETTLSEERVYNPYLV